MELIGHSLLAKTFPHQLESHLIESQGQNPCNQMVEEGS